MALYSIFCKLIIHYSLPLNNHFTEPVIFHTCCAPAWYGEQDESHPHFTVYPPLETIIKLRYPISVNYLNCDSKHLIQNNTKKSNVSTIMGLHTNLMMTYV